MNKQAVLEREARDVLMGARVGRLLAAAAQIESAVVTLKGEAPTLVNELTERAAWLRGLAEDQVHLNGLVAFPRREGS